MLKKAKNLILQALSSIEQAENESQLDAVRVGFLGKRGELTNLLKQLGTMPNNQRAELGELLNQGKQQIQQKISARKELLKEQLFDIELTRNNIDVNLTPIGIELGNLHPITHTFTLVCKLFDQLGFNIVEGPEIEEEYYNFEALNIPKHHPARAMHDTFYFNDGKLLRTHTSTMQIRSMQQNDPPYRLISIGKVYRCDHDLTHTPMFHQVEGLLVDHNINFAHLINILTDFLRCFFLKEDLEIRFRPSYFPFTEPSAEVDMQCFNCNSKGCKVCKFTGWIEILGCGMVHPEVLKNCNVNHDKYTGWAFGIGIDRLAMLKYGINDLRLMFDNDIRFLQQF